MAAKELFELGRESKARNSTEMQMAVFHEGWEALTPAKTRFRLVNKNVVVQADNSEAFWDNVSTELAERYDLSKCQVVLDYVWAHRGQIEDYRKRIEVELGLAKGLGAAESNVDSVLVSRFKRHRRQWSTQGANRLGHLVALRHNGTLERWLEEQRFVEEAKPSLGAKSRESKRHHGEDATKWLQASMLALKTHTRPVVIALRGFSGLSTLSA